MALIVKNAADDTRELVRRAQSGDREAFEALVTPLRDGLLARVCSGMGPALRERLEPQDVLQETLLRALASIDRFEWQGPHSFRRWLEGIARNYLLHAARGVARRREGPLEMEPPSPAPSPSRILRREERFERLERSVGRLSVDYRRVLYLARIEGLTMAQIAERMGRTPDAVRNLLCKALRRLRASAEDTASVSLPARRLERPPEIDESKRLDGAREELDP